MPNHGSIDVEHSQQLRIVETKTVCKTELADATVTVAIADAVDASRCHDSQDNATEKNDYDSNEETTAKSMSTHSNEYQLSLYHYANYN